MEKVFEKIKLECGDDHIGRITLTNSDNFNPINTEVMGDLIECLNICEQDDNVRCVLIRGENGRFSAGGDIKGMKERLDKGINTTRTGLRVGGEFITRLKTIRKPTIACIEGAAAGVGMSIALACDFSIADEASKMTFAFVNIAYVPDGGIAYMLSRAIGTTRATELLMSGRRFTAKEALEWGMITEAVPADQLEETLEKYLKKYSNGPSVTYGKIKALIYNANFPALNACMQDEAQFQHECSLTEDHREAVAAFIEKRKPDFKGR